MDEGLEVLGFTFIANGQSSIVMEPGKAALGFPAALVVSESSAVFKLRLGAVHAMRVDQFHSSFGQTLSVDRCRPPGRRSIACRNAGGTPVAMRYVQS